MTSCVCCVILQVVWLDKYSDELSAARAHDAAVINKLGAAAALAAGQINFTDQIPPAALQQTREPTPPRLSIAPLQLHGSTAAPAQTGAAAAASGDGDSPAASPTGRSRGSGRAARGAQGAKPISQYKVGHDPWVGLQGLKNNNVNRKEHPRVLVCASLLEPYNLWRPCTTSCCCREVEPSLTMCC